MKQAAICGHAKVSSDHPHVASVGIDCLYTLCTTNHTGGSLPPRLVDHPNFGSTLPALSLVYSMLTP